MNENIKTKGTYLKTGLLLILLLMGVSYSYSGQSYPFATVSLNNYDANEPIYYLSAGNRATGPGFYAEILGGPSGGPLLPIPPIGGGPTAFQIDKYGAPGFFDGGYGHVPGAPADGVADFKVRAWHNAASYEAATERVESALLTNVRTGHDSGPPDSLTLYPFPFPSGLIIVPIPEPSPVALGLLGSLLWLLNQRVKFKRK